MRDLTDPDQGRHAINILLADLTTAVARWSALAADIIRRSPVVPITDNYDRLFYEPDAIARSARYSHYIDGMHMLRTHTTAAIPSVLAETNDDRLIVCPGLVYRRDLVDRLHLGEPHQADFWIVRQGRLRRAPFGDGRGHRRNNPPWPCLSRQRDLSSLHDEWARSGGRVR